MGQMNYLYPSVRDVSPLPITHPTSLCHSPAEMICLCARPVSPERVASWVVIGFSGDESFPALC